MISSEFLYEKRQNKAHHYRRRIAIVKEFKRITQYPLRSGRPQIDHGSPMVNESIMQVKLPPAGRDICGKAKGNPPSPSRAMAPQATPKPPAVANLWRVKPSFALWATPRSPLAIFPRASPPSALALQRKTSARGILAKVSEQIGPCQLYVNTLTHKSNLLILYNFYFI